MADCESLNASPELPDVGAQKQYESEQARLVAVAHAKQHTLAQLRQMTWEATQFLSYDEVREFVECVLREAESDEP